MEYLVSTDCLYRTQLNFLDLATTLELYQLSLQISQRRPLYFSPSGEIFHVSYLLFHIFYLLISSDCLLDTFGGIFQQTNFLFSQDQSAIYSSVTFFFQLFFNPHLSICLLILEREERREKQREKYQCERNIDPLPPIHAPTRDQTHNLSVYRMALQPTEPPGQGCFSYFNF